MRRNKGQVCPQVPKHHKIRGPPKTSIFYPRTLQSPVTYSASWTFLCTNYAKIAKRRPKIRRRDVFGSSLGSVPKQNCRNPTAVCVPKFRVPLGCTLKHSLNPSVPLEERKPYKTSWNLCPNGMQHVLCQQGPPEYLFAASWHFCYRTRITTPPTQTLSRTELTQGKPRSK